MTSEQLREVPVERGDTLWKIAHRNRVTVKEIAAVNPQIRDLDKLDIGQKIRIPGGDIGFTLRFVNLLNEPPVGIRYKVLAGKRDIVSGKVTATDNEVSFGARDGEVLTLMAQRKGVSELVPVVQIPVRRRHPVMIVRINSAKIPSKTEPHPKTPPAPAKPPASPAPAAKPPAAPAPAPAPAPAAKPAPKPAAPPPAAKPAPKPAPPPKKVDQGVPNTPAKNGKTEPEHLIVPGDCACGKDVTIDQLAAIFPSRKKADLEKFRVDINKMMKAYSIDSCLRKSHALAQIGHESGGFKYMAEILPKGKTEQVAYKGYKGRGLIQLTGKTNYQKYGKYKGVDFLGENRLKVETIEYATDSAGWFWCHGTSADLNLDADKNDLICISVRINGAYNGLDDRIAIFKRAHKALKGPACKVAKNTSSVYLPFEQSDVYDEPGAVFGWAYWHDPKSTRHGVPKNAGIAKAAYQRFLDLVSKTKMKRPRFGFDDVDEMIEFAKGKVK